MANVTYLERDGGGARLSFVAAQGDPLLLESLLVLEMILHVGEHPVTGRNVPVVGGLVVRPKWILKI